MAGSRLEKIGSIYTRIKGLLRSGAVKDIDRPLWYDVYEAFPPKQSPEYGRPEPAQTVPNILYAEDVIRAQFYKVYGNPDVVDLQNENVKTTCQKFVEKYVQLLPVSKDKGEVFHLTGEALKSQGIRLRTLEEILLEKARLAAQKRESDELKPVSSRELFDRLAAKEASELEELVEPGSEEYR